MTFTHDDIRQHLVDYLCGELAADARAAFDAHTDACDACRAEVGGLGEARTVGRAAVRAPLARPLPPGVHERVMEAAKRAAEKTVAKTAEAQTSAVAPSAARVRPASRWTSWLRARWTVPVLTTAAAMGAMLLGRETIFREARQPPVVTRPADQIVEQAPEVRDTGTLRGTPPLADESPPSEAPAAATAPREAKTKAEAAAKKQAEKYAAAPRPAGQPRPASASNPAASERKPVARRKASPVGRGVAAAIKGAPVIDVEQTEPTAVPSVGAPAKRSLDQLLDSVASSDSAPRPQAKMREEAPSGLAPTSAAAVSETEDAERADERANERRAGVAVRSGQGGTPTVPAQKGFAVGPPPQGARSANAPPPRSAAAEDAHAQALAEERVTTARPTSGSPPEAGETLAMLSVRADKLMAMARWSDAVNAYRELLRRFPAHPNAPTWRRRLASAQAAQNRPIGR